MNPGAGLNFVGIGILVIADNFSAFWGRHAGEVKWTRKFASVTSNRTFEKMSMRLYFKKRG